MRFLFGLPVALLIMGYMVAIGHEVPETSMQFWLYSIIGSITQIIGNLLLVSLFSRRNFVVGITYSKTEAILSALLAFCLFGDSITTGGFIAIVIGFVGIVMISIVEQHINFMKLLKGAANKVAFIGLACGFFYAIAGVMIRQASLSLEAEVLTSAVFTLTAMLAMQAVLLGAWVVFKYGKDVRRIYDHAGKAALVGLTNTLASVGWFTGFTLVQAAYVLAVGQVEVLFSLLVTHKIFKEHVNRLEIAGMILVVGSIIALVFVH